MSRGISASVAATAMQGQETSFSLPRLHAGIRRHRITRVVCCLLLSPQIMGYQYQYEITVPTRAGVLPLPLSISKPNPVPPTNGWSLGGLEWCQLLWCGGPPPTPKLF